MTQQLELATRFLVFGHFETATNYDTLVSDLGQAGDDPALSKDSAPPWRGFLWPPHSSISREQLAGGYLGAQGGARGHLVVGPAAGHSSVCWNQSP